MSDYNEQMNIAKKVMEEDKEVLSKISDFKSVKQLCEENPNLNNHILSLTDIIAKLEVNNIDLTNKVIRLEKEKADLVKRHIELEDSLTELRKYYQSFDKFATTVYDPNKSTYKELEEKLALAENSKQTEIDELYETKIGPLQNKVKDQHIQLESQYKRETKLQQEIKNLKDTIHDAETVINFAVGYISATQPHTDKHPMEVKKWLYEGVFREIQNNN